MVIADPAAELLRLVTGPGDPPALEADPGAQRSADLIRRRFGLALPAPFVPPPGAEEPVRAAVPLDAAAIAATKWRSFGVDYRGGILPDDFLDRREVVPPPTYWLGRALLPPSRRHRLLVWGRPGTVYGYVDLGPARPDDGDGEASSVDTEAGEVFELYVDPAAQGRGGGRRLLEAAHEWFAEVGWARGELHVLAGNERAQAFYRAHGWAPTGEVTHVDLGTVAFDECRYAISIPHTRP